MTLPLFAVHIADGILSPAWLVAGFALTAVAVFFAARKVADDELPRIALLTAAFFVASSIHVRIGPTSVHLLLGGLVGVVLAGRAPLAILVGVAMQAVLLAHGGWTTIGVNALVQIVPAVLVGLSFPVALRLVEAPGRAWLRSALVVFTALLATGAVLLGVSMLTANPWAALKWNDAAGLVVSLGGTAEAFAFLASPWAIGILVASAISAFFLDRRWPSRGEFALGALAGMLGVLLTTLLVGVVLVSDGAEAWRPFATAVYVAHLPLALIEGLIVGATAAYLARVKPEMLAARRTRGAVAAAVAVACLLATATPVSAHAMMARARADLTAKKVRVEVSFETGDAPESGTVEVQRDDGEVVAKGALDSQGAFSFAYEKPERLRVVAYAPGGHKARTTLTAEELGGTGAGQGEARPERWRDLLLGVTFLLALAAFVMGWKNSRRGREFDRVQG